VRQSKRTVETFQHNERFCFCLQKDFVKYFSDCDHSFQRGKINKQWKRGQTCPPAVCSFCDSCSWSSGFDHFYLLDKWHGLVQESLSSFTKVGQHIWQVGWRMMMSGRDVLSSCPCAAALIRMLLHVIPVVACALGHRSRKRDKDGWVDGQTDGHVKLALKRENCDAQGLWC